MTERLHVRKPSVDGIITRYEGSMPQQMADPVIGVRKPGIAELPC
ncbi:hypothetical protein [Pseudomonas sp. NFX15]